MVSFEIELEPDVPIQQSPEEMLFDFLYKLRQHHELPIVSRMFNSDFSVTDTVVSASYYLAESQQKFEDLTRDNVVELDNARYVHVSSITTEGSQSRYSRSFLKVPEDKKRSKNSLNFQCPTHKRKCKLLEYVYGFICFLHANNDDDHVGKEDPQERTEEAPTEEEGIEEREEEINWDAERELSAALDIETVRNEADALHKVDVGGEEGGDRIPTFALPTFPVGDREYVLATDIQEVFDLREDYFLAIVAQNLDGDEDLVDPNVDKYLLLDTNVKDSEFIDAAETLTMVYRDAMRYEANLPSEEEFEAIQQRLKITEMGKLPVREEPVVETNSTVDIWTDNMLVHDENQRLVVYEDDFITRGAGKRVEGLGKDSALGHYIGRLKHPQIIVFHNKYSKDNALFPLFAIKTLSRYLGGHPVRWNADKIILVEKQFAVRTFGQGPGTYVMRHKYFLMLAGYGLICGVGDPKLLHDVGRNEMIRLHKQPMKLGVHTLEDVPESSSKRAKKE